MNIQHINQLVFLIRAGDKEQFYYLLHEYRDYLNKQIYIYFAPGMDKDDIYQEASIALYKSVCSFNESKGEFVPYSYLCIQGHLKNVVKAALRKKHYLLNTAYRLDQTINENDEMTYKQLIPSCTDTPEAHYIQVENKNELYKLYDCTFKRVSKKEQLIFINYLNGYSYNDISIKMNITEKSVDNALYRIKKKIKNHIISMPIVHAL